MTGYPWDEGAELHFYDLNAAIATVTTQAGTAQTTASLALAQAAAALAAQGIQPFSVTLNWPASAAAAGTYVLSATMPYNVLVSSVDASIGTAGGILSATFRSNSVTIGNLGGLLVSQATKTNTPAVAGPSNPLTIGAGTLLDVVVTITSGTPVDAYLCLLGTRTA